MSKGIMQSLTKFGLPLGLGIVGSLSLVVWSQKPAVSTARKLRAAYLLPPPSLIPPGRFATLLFQPAHDDRAPAVSAASPCAGRR